VATLAPPLSTASELWHYRELLRRLVVRHLMVRYQRSALGFLWALINPLLTIVLMVVVFGQIIRIDVPSYWAFLISGYFAWVFTLHTLGTSVWVLPEHASMLKSMVMPAETLVLGAVMARLIEFAAELVLVVLVLAIFHHHGVPASIVMLPLLLALQFLFTLGLAMPAATAAVFFRDVQHAIPVVLTLVAYVSPVFYPARLVPDHLRAIYRLNPLVGMLELYHTVLYEGRFPALGSVLAFAAVSLGVFGIGYWIFRRQRETFAEIV
jgi:homopolymeric O-antigen transport system permease protein